MNTQNHKEKLNKRINTKKFQSREKVHSMTGDFHYLTKWEKWIIHPSIHSFSIPHNPIAWGGYSSYHRARGHPGQVVSTSQRQRRQTTMHVKWISYMESGNISHIIK